MIKSGIFYRCDMCGKEAFCEDKRNEVIGIVTSPRAVNEWTIISVERSDWNSIGKVCLCKECLHKFLESLTDLQECHKKIEKETENE